MGYLKTGVFWLAPLASLLTTVALWLIQPAWAFESSGMVLDLYVFFVLPVSLAIASLAAHNYRHGGDPGLLCLGSGALLWGASGVAGGALGTLGPNPMVTAHNLLVLLSGVAHLAGIVLSARPGTRKPGLHSDVVAAYVLALSVVGFVCVAVWRDLLPPFFLPGSGGTPLRQLVLTLAVVVFFYAFAVLYPRGRMPRQPFSRYYGMAMLLISIGLLDLLIQPATGSAIGWAGRITQLVGTLYMLGGVVRAALTAYARHSAISIELDDSRKQFDSLLDLVGDGIATFRLKADGTPGLFVQFNQAWLTLCGYPASDLARLALDDLLLPPAGSAPQAFWQGLRDGGLSGEAELVRAGGERIPVEVATSRIRFEGRWLVLCLIHDLRRQQAIRQSLEQARQAADAANAAKSRFLASMSHEIRTPLSAVLGFSRLLDGLVHDREGRNYLRQLDGAGQHLLSIINNILDLAKIEAGKIVLDERDFALPALLEEVRSLVGPMADAKGLAVQIDVDPSPLCLRGDPTRLRQCLLNLAFNAVKFTERGEVRLGAELRRIGPGGVEVCFEVVDTGIGIAPDAMTRLFEEFEQVGGSLAQSQGGSGLGLAITRRLARLMGGDVEARSEVGRGSCFRLVVPLGLGRVSMPEDVSDEAGLIALHQAHGGKRVLLAEDDPLCQLLTARQLRDAGLQVDVVGNGREAIDLALREPYDLILMDMEMPEVNGIEATRALRAASTQHTVPIVAMTANAFEEDRRACIEAGMDEFLSKPIDPPVLYSLVGRMLDGQRAQPARIG